MVNITHPLLRVPVIRFRKGGLGRPAAPQAVAAAPAASATPQAAAAPIAQAAPMSTSAIPDLDLPVRYRRQPLSEEEIAHINGGGIV